MESMNPYQSPVADVSARPNNGGYDESNPFSPKGRFGRLSYIAWSLLLYIPIWLANIIIGVQAGMSGASNPPTIQPILIALMFIYAIPMVLFAIRRLHDINSSGWWAVLLFVPIPNLILWLVLVFRRGTDGSNNFGPERLTRGWENVLGRIGILFMVIAVIGIIAAIAIPLYTASHAIH